jgi:hypothetical protein
MKMAYAQHHARFVSYSFDGQRTPLEFTHAYVMKLRPYQTSPIRHMLLI